MKRPTGWRAWLAALALGAALVALAILSHSHMRAQQFDQAAERGQNTLGLAVSALRGELARYENLSELIADHALVLELIRQPDDAARRAALNRYLEQINTLLGSSDIYVMLPDGETIAASNHALPDTFIGHNFSYRPYFQDAMTGGQGRFFALGTTSLKRGYYFGAPIRLGDSIGGVVVFKVDIDGIESTWRGSGYELIVSDPEGIIFMSGRSDWMFAALEPLTRARIARTNATRRYADAELRELPVQRHSQGPHELLTLRDGTSSREYLVLTQAMPEADWRVKVLLDTAPARMQALTGAAALVLLAGLGLMGLAVWRQRRARHSERMQVQREAQAELERRVEERTRDLAAVNHRLEDEVVERRATERELRKAQADLVQAGKLAALGQMSAALSHEFNQPLAAVRANAENATVLIERGRIPEARETVERIAALTERMAELSRHLRNFARRPKSRLHAVALADVLRDTLAIIEWRLRAADVAVAADLGPDPLYVLAGPVRLQQVLVNILSNAADAVEALPERRITLTARRQGDRVRITVADNGPGVDPAIAGRIFDPFFSTKGVGKGLGLGLSISYNIVKDFGGSLTLASPPGGGAQFTIDLAAAAAIPLTEAAE